MWCDQYHRHIEGKAVLAIAATPAYPDFPDQASFQEIAFYVDGYRIFLSANNDTDEIVVAVEERALPSVISPMHPVLAEYIGRSFGWCWSAINSQGYSDFLILAFGDDLACVSPCIGFLVEASDIHLQRIAPV